MSGESKRSLEERSADQMRALHEDLKLVDVMRDELKNKFLRAENVIDVFNDIYAVAHTHKVMVCYIIICNYYRYAQIFEDEDLLRKEVERIHSILDEEDPAVRREVIDLLPADISERLQPSR